MTTTLACPHCQRQLLIQESDLGSLVRCPACQQDFTAASRPAPASVPTLEALEPDPIEDEEDEEERSRPHRGGLILALGVLSCLLCFCPLGGWLLGGCTMSLANTDIYQMALRRMDRSGRGLTRAGKILGAIAVTLSTIFFILGVINFVSGTIRF